MRHDFAGAIGTSERSRLHFSSRDADDFAGIDPVRILHDVGVAAEDLRPAERVLQVGLRQIPECVALLHHVLHFPGGVGGHDEVVRGIGPHRLHGVGLRSIGRGRHLCEGAIDAGRRKNQRGAEDGGADG